MTSGKIVIGLDFDGVVAYNPIRILRLPVVLAKRYILRETKTHFFVPKTPLQKRLWALIFEASIFPALGCAQLATLVADGAVEAHLVTARFDFMKDHLYRWLEKEHMKQLFTSISVNTKNEQPHIYKARIVKEKKFDYFVEDNLDIVRYLDGKTKTKIFWIYNIFDRHIVYKHKFPFLKKALAYLL